MTLAVEDDRFTDQRAIRVEAGTPQRLRENDYAVVALLLLFRQECPAEDRLNAEKHEEIVRSANTGGRCRLPSAGDLDRFAADQRGLFNGGTLCRPFACVYRVDSDWSERGEARIHLAHRIQSLGVLEGQRLEEHGVDQRKDGGGRADPDGEREDGNRGEAGTAADSANRKAEILRQNVQRRQTALIAIAFLCRFDAAELEPGAA